ETLYTSSMATAAYLRETAPGASAYVIGTDSLKETIEASGLILTEEDADYVVMGLDPEINYEKLSKGTLMINAGARFIATNPDKKFPTEKGFVPGNGSLVSVLTVATGIEPVFIGKPKGIILESAVAALGLPKEDVLMVGDNYDTDILTGINGGVDTLHVNTGVTPKEDVAKETHPPTYLIDNLKEWSVRQLKKIVITRNINPDIVDKLRKDFEGSVWEEDQKPMPREKFLEDTKDAHAVLTMLSDKVDEEFLSNAPEMKVVANLAVGFDNIDLDAAERHEVVITNTPDVLT